MGGAQTSPGDPQSGTAALAKSAQSPTALRKLLDVGTGEWDGGGAISREIISWNLGSGASMSKARGPGYLVALCDWPPMSTLPGNTQDSDAQGPVPS